MANSGAGWLVSGSLLTVMGLLLSLTFIGAFCGIPMLLIGIPMLVFGKVQHNKFILQRVVDAEVAKTQTVTKKSYHYDAEGRLVGEHSVNEHTPSLNEDFNRRQTGTIPATYSVAASQTLPEPLAPARIDANSAAAESGGPVVEAPSSPIRQPTAGEEEGE